MCHSGKGFIPRPESSRGHEAVMERRSRLHLLTRPWTLLLLLYVGYVILGLIIFARFSNEDFGDNYQGIAHNLLSGRGFSDPSPPKGGRNIPEASLLAWWEKNDIAFGSTRPHQPTARCMPLYPLWLALWFKLFGVASPLVQIVQVMFLGLIRSRRPSLL